MAAISSFNPLSVDDSYFLALIDEEEIFPLQETFLACSIPSGSQLSSSDRLRILSTLDGNRKGKSPEAAEPSSSYCTICMDAKPSTEMFNISMVKCPEPTCKGILQPECFQSVLPLEAFKRWEDALSESWVIGSQKFYCPFRDCSALLVDDGGEVVTASECPNCRRMFCAQCRASWHSGMDCGQFRTGIRLLAKNKKWRRCPNCKFYVEKLEGCLHISCRCGCQFCYGRGSTWTTEDHACRSA
ncbi:Ubiquitin--protein ligase [Bertholletia excelsa]